MVNHNPKEFFIDEKSIDSEAIVIFQDKNYFKGFLVDFEYMNLNDKFINSLDRNYYPLDHFFSVRNSLTSSELKIMDKIVLLMNKQNNLDLTAEKTAKFKSKSMTLLNKFQNVKFLLLYIFLYLSQKERNIEINQEIVEIIEDIVVDYLPNFFTLSKVDYEALVYIIYICYEINFISLAERQTVFTSKFLKFLKSLGIWHKEEFWTECISVFKKMAGNPFVDLYYSSLRNYSKHGSKVNIKYMKDVYEFAVFVGFHLLKVPFNSLFDIFNSINDRDKDINVNVVMDISKDLEDHIGHNYSKVYVSMINSGVSKERHLSIEFVIKKAIAYLDFEKDSLLNLIYLNKQFRRRLYPTVFKQILFKEDIQKDLRIKLWNSVTESDEDLQIFLDKDFPEKQTEKYEKILQMANLVNLVKLDVKRTSFISEAKREMLEVLLLKTAKNFPSILYYQGMNCIGGYLVEYTESEECSYNVINYLLKNKLEKYFRNNFSQLNKILFVSEKFLQTYNAAFVEIMKENNIKTDFYLSPLLLTIFTCTLQYVGAEPFIAKFFDLFIAGGWKFVYKFIVYLSWKLLPLIKDYKHENLLIFLKKDLFDVICGLELHSFKYELKKMPISNAQIRANEQEYNHSRFIVDIYWAEFYENKKLRIKSRTSSIIS
jgi:hypothetical protein